MPRRSDAVSEADEDGAAPEPGELRNTLYRKVTKGKRKLTPARLWLYRVAVNACLNRVALKKPATAELDPAAHVDTRVPNPLDDVLRMERAEAVRAAIAKLPPKQRATLMLRVYQECSHEEIATALGSTVGAVKANFFHALGNLRRMLGTS